jgi:hypothetical protein
MEIGTGGSTRAEPGIYEAVHLILQANVDVLTNKDELLLVILSVKPEIRSLQEVLPN